MRAWQLRVQVAGRVERFRFVRPEAAGELLQEIARLAAWDYALPDVGRVAALTPGSVLRGDRWSVRRADLPPDEFLAMTMC